MPTGHLNLNKANHKMMIWYQFLIAKWCQKVSKNSFNIVSGNILVPVRYCDVRKPNADVFSRVPFHKFQDTLLHPGINDQMQNTQFSEDLHVTRALLGGFGWQPGSARDDLNWSALVNHIGIHPLPTTQPTLTGDAQYIKPRPSQFWASRARMEMARFVCEIFNWLKLLFATESQAPNYCHRVSLFCVVVMTKWQKIAKNMLLGKKKAGYCYTNPRLTYNVLYAEIPMKNCTVFKRTIYD